MKLYQAFCKMKSYVLVSNRCNPIHLAVLESCEFEECWTSCMYVLEAYLVVAYACVMFCRRFLDPKGCRWQENDIGAHNTNVNLI